MFKYKIVWRVIFFLRIDGVCGWVVRIVLEHLPRRVLKKITFFHVARGPPLSRRHVRFFLASRARFTENVCINLECVYYLYGSGTNLKMFGGV
jgi:hypothetical protein